MMTSELGLLSPPKASIASKWFVVSAILRYFFVYLCDVFRNTPSRSLKNALYCTNIKSFRKLNAFRAIHCVVLIYVASNNAWAESSAVVSFEQNVHSLRQGPLFKAQTWVQGKFLRMEYQIGTQNIVSLLTPEGKTYNFDIVKGIGTMKSSTPSSDVAGQFGPDIFTDRSALEHFLRLVDAKVIREEIYDQKECWVYEYETPEKQMTSYIWIWKNRFFPLKSVIYNPQDEITVHYSDVRFQEQAVPGLFELPKNIQWG